ncbi:C6 transcription factor [Aspergillus floccosus]
MRPPLTKRACDECIARKVKCSGAWPCNTCSSGPKQVPCTYLKPARRRGPKVRRVAPSENNADRVRRRSPGEGSSTSVARAAGSVSLRADAPTSSTVAPSVLVAVVQRYRDASFSVWPVVNAEALLSRLENCPSETLDRRTHALATALCAATMAQLQMAPVDANGQVDSTVLAGESMRVREASNYRENLDAISVLVSFFLHVYHAKINRRNAAMMFIQEALSGARILRLDEAVDGDGDRDGDGTCEDDVIINREILFTLLWVSERGYAMHLGLAPSFATPVRWPDATSQSSPPNVHVQGLVSLARLFAAFDAIAVSRSGGSDVSAVSLAETEEALSVLSLQQGEGDRASTRMADYCITKEWMRTIIWQEALSRHLLSSAAYVELMTFRFPTLVSRDLLFSLKGFTQSDLLPLGRDQLLKCFEVANSLADTVLYTSALSGETFRLRPQDFLHALYQRLVPFLDQDPLLKSILHAKTAEALVKAPARLLTVTPSEERPDDQSPIEEYLDLPCDS